MSEEKIITVVRSRIRKVWWGSNALIAVVLLLILWGMLNYLASRHYWREDWSAQQIGEISPKTLDVLTLIREEVEIVVVAKEDYDGLDELKELLAAYQSHSPLLRVEYVDPLRDLARMEKLARTAGIKKSGQLLLSLGKRQKVIALSDFVRSVDTVEEGSLSKDMVEFQGEAILTSGLISLVHSESKRVYFLTGHGEKDVDNFDLEMSAYSNVRVALERDNFQVRSLNLDGRQAVPADCDVLVIAGPTSRISQPELDVLVRYLAMGGQLVVMVDAGADAGLRSLLADYGVQLLPDWVVDARFNSSGATDVWVSNYAKHPITDPLQGKNTIYIRPRSITPVSGITAADKPVYYAIAACSEHGWGNLDVDENPVRFHADRDVPGPVPIAAVVEKVRSGAGEDATPTRLVVFGDSDFASNRLGSGAGVELVRNSVNWLGGQTGLINIPPKSMETLRLELDRGGMNRLFVIVSLLLPLCVGVAGCLIWWRRRK